MEKKELDQFIEWYKTTDEFKNLPEAEKPITLAMMIKKAMNTVIKIKEDGSK